ncbi:hypothetical protein CONCODRAFT_11587 [Conidiobolus coronatus NRRL 28638]|uniref:Cyanovirin-N domain-containing protein n=1 Tax=Conidiobolus coronatus (strain ATCC 28846 / CBS 209.66 / NRRL 28638) TaxID=796925 RepID=A0A137NUY4_CONC2|nr:hypothetical protein CONCODRAFT_11587 [Conidiobolus coronatus NRRL 28638]|eukprot:KXN66542.1 hypothetical protein CONCODRAFT_11587 [Conidiobolus coronatus NRRL 28638]
MNLILTLTSLVLVQASRNAYCENNGAKKTHMRGSAIYDGDIIIFADCYNYGEDGCPIKLEKPSDYDAIFSKCKHEFDSEDGEIAYKLYMCDEPNRLFEWQDIFRSKGWTCDEIH